MLRFQLPLLAVRDIEVSKSFYSRLFDQNVVLDLGKNVTLSGGFALQEDFAWLTGLEAGSVISRSHNMELYFETDDFDGFLKKLGSCPGVELVHPPMTHDWHQQVVRIYDPDGHMIEIGEAMDTVARRFMDLGHSIEETAGLIQHPVEFVAAASRKENPIKTKK